MEIQFRKLINVNDCKHREEDILMYTNDRHNMERYCCSCGSYLNPHGIPLNERRHTYGHQ